MQAMQLGESPKTRLEVPQLSMYSAHGFAEHGQCEFQNLEYLIIRSRQLRATQPSEQMPPPTIMFWKKGHWPNRRLVEAEGYLLPSGFISQFACELPLIVAVMFSEVPTCRRTETNSGRSKAFGASASDRNIEMCQWPHLLSHVNSCMFRLHTGAVMAVL